MKATQFPAGQQIPAIINSTTLDLNWGVMKFLKII